MKLRYLLPLAGVLCTFLTAHAQPSPARQAFYEGACRISPRTMLCYETPLAPLAAYLREYINVETASDSMSADDAIVLSTDPTLGGEAFRLTVLPPKYTPRTVRFRSKSPARRSRTRRAFRTAV